MLSPVTMIDPRRSLSVAWIAVLAACGDGTGDPSSESPLLVDLTEQELAELCEGFDQAALADELAVEGNCLIRAGGFAVRSPEHMSAPVDGCETFRAECEQAPPIEFCQGRLLPDCPATVDSFGECVDQFTGRWREAAMTRTCESQVQRSLAYLQNPVPDVELAPCNDQVNACFQVVIVALPDGGVGIQQ